MVDSAVIARAEDALCVTVVRRLAAGPGKTVLLVESARGQAVMKVVCAETDAPEALTSARREVALLRTLEHPNLVRALSEVIEVPGAAIAGAWLEEYLDGDDLCNLLDARWAWPAVKAMMLDVARGLARLHAIDVVHRDLSVHNVRRLSAGRWAVMDLGSARYPGQVTVGGQPGTAGFLSPEHVRKDGVEPSPASDVFCVANLAVLAITGRVVVPVATDIDDYVVQLKGFDGLDAATLPEVPNGVAALLTRCLDPRPSHRFADADHLAAALAQL
jgi:serine/threonine-protein kinase